MICESKLGQLFHRKHLQKELLTKEVLFSLPFLFLPLWQVGMAPLSLFLMRGIHCLHNHEFGKNLSNYLLPVGVYKMGRWKRRAFFTHILRGGTKRWPAKETAIHRDLCKILWIKDGNVAQWQSKRDLKTTGRMRRGRSSRMPGAHANVSIK